jgi:hypothetical protein
MKRKAIRSGGALGASFVLALGASAACTTFESSAASTDAGADSGSPVADALSPDADAASNPDASGPPKSCATGECTVVVTSLLTQTCDGTKACDTVYGVAVANGALFWTLTNVGTSHSVVQSCALPGCTSRKTFTVGGSAFVNVAAVAATSTAVFWTESEPSGTYAGVYSVPLDQTCFDNGAPPPPCAKHVGDMTNPIALAIAGSGLYVADSAKPLKLCNDTTCTNTDVITARAVAISGSDVLTATDTQISKCADSSCTSTSRVADVIDLVNMTADAEHVYWTAQAVGGNGKVVTCEVAACASTMRDLAVGLGAVWGIAMDDAMVYVGTTQANGTIYGISR